MEDQRFVKRVEIIVLDTKTKLEWMVGPDVDTTWIDAKKWVDSLGRGWRLPTIAELQTLYEQGRGPNNLNPLLDITTGTWIWSSEHDDLDAWDFSFTFGYKHRHAHICARTSRVFVVRESGK